MIELFLQLLQSQNKKNVDVPYAYMSVYVSV